MLEDDLMHGMIIELYVVFFFYRHFVYGVHRLFAFSLRA